MGRTMNRIVKPNIIGQNGFRIWSCIERQERGIIILVTKKPTTDFHLQSIL